MLIFGGEATRIGQKRYDNGKLKRYLKTLRTAILCPVLIGAVLLAPGCGISHTSTKPLQPPAPPAPPAPPMSLIVNSLEDSASPPPGVTTLRSAIAEIGAGGTVTFDAGLNGQTILLSIVGETHSMLQGEAYSGMTFLGYQSRDYGASALYARKSLIIDASALPDGITIRWNGGDAGRSRVMAVYGDLTLKHITVTGGHSYAEPIATGSQPYTLARGGGLAVWGTLMLEHATVAGNRCTGDLEGSRDRGTYGGGIYADGLHLQDSVVSGNWVIGYGAAGGGIYSVGGAMNAGWGNDTYLDRCAVTGNRSTGEHSYGGGIFTLSGGPDHTATMYVTNCTVARNLVEDHPDIPESGQYYTRGGGIYMGGGSLSLVSSTVVENAVTGHPATFSGSPNMGGGGIAATIGNAHVVEAVFLRNSIVAGNSLNSTANDWFVGSILDFYSEGYNLVGYVDFSRILVPVSDWWAGLSRKHWPKIGDVEGVTISDALDVAAVRTHPWALSAGTDVGQPAILWYPPANLARDRIPAGPYDVTYVSAGYEGSGLPTDDFLNQVLAHIRTLYGSVLGSDFGASFGDMTGTTFYGPAVTWPTNPQNAPWIAFWRDLDIAIGGRLGMAGLNDDFWDSCTPGPLGSHVTIYTDRMTNRIDLTGDDQLGNPRPQATLGDIGAIEK